MNNTSKQCTKCGVEKPLTAFGKKQKAKDGLTNHCRNCLVMYQRNYREKNKDKLAQKQQVRDRSYHEQNKEQIQARGRDYHLKRAYGIDINQYNTIKEQQNSRCKICQIHETEVSGARTEYRSFYIDHNHINGKIRGLLCFYCNSLLGFFKDSVETIDQAIDYLERDHFG